MLYFVWTALNTCKMLFTVEYVLEIGRFRKVHSEHFDQKAEIVDCSLVSIDSLVEELAHFLYLPV